MHILSPETDNCPSWISGRERMTVENISWSISTKECCRPRRRLNPRPPGLQSDGEHMYVCIYIHTDIIFSKYYMVIALILVHIVASCDKQKKKKKKKWTWARVTIFLRDVIALRRYQKQRHVGTVPNIRGHQSYIVVPSKRVDIELYLHPCFSDFIAHFYHSIFIAIW